MPEARDGAVAMRKAILTCAALLAAGTAFGGCGSDDDKAALTPSLASTDVKLTPTTTNFGPEEPGIETAQRTFILSVSAGAFTPQVSTSGDFTQTNDCPPQITGGTGAQCLIYVRFLPQDLGPRTGVLSTGGPTAQLRGLGEEGVDDDADDSGSKPSRKALAKCKKAKSKKAKKRCRKKAVGKAAKQAGGGGGDEDDEEGDEEE